MPSDCNGVSCFQQIFEKKLNIYLWSLGIFTFLWVLAPSWEHLGCRFLCQQSLVELQYRLIDLNQDSKVIQGVKKGKLKKTTEISTFFVNFRLINIQNCSFQIKKMKDGIFSFQMKKNYFCRTLTDDARHKNVPPPLDLTWILKPYHKRNDKVSRKIGTTNTAWDKSRNLIGQKLQHTFQ